MALSERRGGKKPPDVGASAPSTTEASLASTQEDLTSAPAPSLAELGNMARRLRRHVVTMTNKAGSGHPGGSLSAVEIVTSLFFRVLHHDATNPRWEDRDRFVLSKGHAAPLLYAALAESGYFPIEELSTLRKLDSRLQGHTDMTETLGVEMSAGPVGQGLSFSIGIALAGRLNSRGYRVYVLLGDGECDEGQVWEAAMAAVHFKLDNIVAIVDRNRQQLDGWTRDIMNLEPLAEKWRSFGWHVIEVDGHDFDQLLSAFDEAKKIEGRPTCVVAHTIKGKGVSFMENNPEFHGRAPNDEELRQALEELK
jgi:transketolase